jgi:hypothetical protein
MSDDYETPKEAWEAIAHLIPRDKVIWESFYMNGKSGEYLRELGFSVIHENEDFFQHNKGDIVVSNPPFSKKKEIIKRLVELQKSFILIMPDTTLTTRCVRIPGLQLIVPKKRIQFVEGKSASFGCLYYCYLMNLEKDITFL